LHRDYASGALIAALLIGAASAQTLSPLPPPSSTVFKCEADGRTVYSDSPCLGAEKLEIEPTDSKAPDAHRTKLAPASQRECQRLDAEVPRLEAEERRAREQVKPEVQRKLFALRKHFRELRC
jgi:uncharacterized protein DUF4124